MGPPPPAPQQGPGFCAPWPWGIAEQQKQSSPDAWWPERMEGLEGGGASGGGAGLRFSLPLDPGNPGLDHHALLGVSLSTLFSRLLWWSRKGGSMVIAEDGRAVSAATGLTAAVSICLAARYASHRRPRQARRRRRRLPAPALAAPNPVPAARPRELPAPDDGLRFLSSNDESLESVIHGASIGAGDDEEDDIVARVETTRADMNADDETEDGQSEQERQKLERMKELWLSLVEREQRLELRLQELESVREQEATVRELESRVAAVAMEARLLELRVSSLQEENGRLRAQAAELDAAHAELACAKEKLRAIKVRLQGEQEEARREAAALRTRVEELERGGEERATALAEEAAALRRANASLEEENMELSLRLQDAQQAASSVNLVLEEDMVEEARYLRETNERLTRQIEQLHSDHCAHVEELVYLKWVNACLRHELRDHDDSRPSSEQHDHVDAAAAGGLSALELSKSMSFRSSERAKQLMLRYGHPGLDGFNPALLSLLHESELGGVPERSPVVPVMTTTTMAAAAAAPGKKGGPRKLKLLGNIKKLLPGGGGKRSESSHAGRERRNKAPAAPPRDEYLEKAMQWLSTHDVLDGDHSYESTPLSSCDRTPLSSATTATTRGGWGGGGVCVDVHSERGEPARPAEAEPALARSKSDAGASYGREASPYHALRPDHPASGGGVEPDKHELRRRSEDLRSPAAAASKYVNRTRDVQAE